MTAPLHAAVGVATAQKLEKELGLRTIADLLRHYPRRYDKLGQLTPLADLPRGEAVTILARVVSASTRPMRRNPRQQMLTLVVTDGVDELSLTFFNASYLKHRLTPGTQAFFSGTVTEYRGKPQLSQPKVALVGDDDAQVGDALDNLDKPIPVYPATAKVTTDVIRKSVGMTLDQLGELDDPLPTELRARKGLPRLRESLELLHRPVELDEWRPARRRLLFEEAFVLQVALARRRLVENAAPAVPRVPRPGGLLDAFDARLPFTLTAGQREVGRQLAEDLAGEHPMHRLLQGEVGSGKTLVALRAMLAVVDSGGQAALLAPTEVLAAQHFRSITAMLGDLAAGGMLGGDERATRVALLTGSQTTAQRRAALLDVVSGDAGIVVGTHALLQENVEFQDLGLVVVDEQHRFGVDQRDMLRGKGRSSPHLLVMTATPIPRTVAMTVFGDLETSTLTELPAGRSPIATHLVPLADQPAWYGRVWRRMREEVDQGRQAYVVCPRIGEEGETSDTGDGPVGSDGADESDEAARGDGDETPNRRPLRGVLEVLEELRANPDLAGLSIGMLHGRMPADAREATMRAFAAGDLQVLVATTVIEVGVDVPNASTMVVLDADRFGVSQLHQLRGRVGRGSVPGVCLLVSDAGEGTSGRERLDAVAKTLDGFELARVDLEQRREGDVLGSRQSGGRSSLKLLRVLRDEDVIEEARHEATALVAADPELEGHPALVTALRELLDEEREAYLERG